jgi:hypothetical protein
VFVIVSIGAVALGVAVLVGFTLTVIVMKREDKAASLSRTAPTTTAALSRRLMGLHVINEPDHDAARATTGRAAGPISTGRR